MDENKYLIGDKWLLQKFDKEAQDAEYDAKYKLHYIDDAKNGTASYDKLMINYGQKEKGQVFLLTIEGEYEDTDSKKYDIIPYTFLIRMDGTSGFTRYTYAIPDDGSAPTKLTLNVTRSSYNLIITINEILAGYKFKVNTEGIFFNS